MNSKFSKTFNLIVLVFIVLLNLSLSVFAATTDKDLVLDDDTGDSPQVLMRDADENTFSLKKLDAGGADIINDEGAINIKPSNDIDDYFTFTTDSDISYLYWLGVLAYTNAPGLRVNSATGKLEYRDEDAAIWTAFDSLGAGGLATFAALSDTDFGAGAAQGNIAYYNGTNWVNLAVGTAGQVLQTQGAGANPIWVDESGSVNAEVSTAEGQLLFGDAGGNWDHTETSELFWDDANKRLGIGTDTPQSIAHIKSDVDGDYWQLILENGGVGNDTGTLINFALTGATSIPAFISSYWKNSEYDMALRIGSGGTTSANGNTVATFLYGDTRGARVGIGTADPDQKLHIYGTENVYEIIETDEGWVTTFVDANTTWDHAILFDNSHDLRILSSTENIGSSTTEIMRFRADGTLGHVDNHLKVKSDGAWMRFSVEATGTGGFNPSWVGLFAGEKYIPAIYWSEDDLRFLGDATTNDGGGSSEFMRIQSSTGNIGIGTDSPSALLEINGEARLTNAADMGSNDESLATKKYVDDNVGGSGYWDRDAGNGYIYPNTLTDKIGIGTASPSNALFQIDTATNSQAFDVTNGGTTFAHLVAEGAGGTNAWGFYEKTFLTLDNTIASPFPKLSVANQPASAQALIWAQGDAGHTTDHRLNLSADGEVWLYPRQAGDVVTVTNGGNLRPYWTDVSDIGDATHKYKNLYLSGNASIDGKVGIGTATPGSMLEVENTASANDVLLLQDSSGTCEAQPTTTGLTWSCSSDIRLKENITQASNILDYIFGIPLFDYTVKKTGERVMGPVAQNMQDKYPELVTEGDDGYLTVSELSQWQLVKAIQELTEKNAKLKIEKDSQITELTMQITQLKDQNTQIIKALCNIDPTGDLCK